MRNIAFLKGQFVIDTKEIPDQSNEFAGTERLINKFYTLYKDLSLAQM